MSTHALLPLSPTRKQATFVLTPHDPLSAFLLKTAEPVEVPTLHMASPALDSLKAAGITLVVPLISQGELVSVLALGARLSEQTYCAEDRKLLNTLAIQTASALRVAQMVRGQQEVIRERERIEQELRIAQQIQRMLLPKALPLLPEWQVSAFYQPAREVGGDFYDFLSLENDQLGIVIGDVSGKGVPAALVMATTRSMLRSVARQQNSPGTVLQQVNDQLVNDIPQGMFVTCLYAILDPSSGQLRYANAGHDQPYHYHNGIVTELKAVGMPLGLMEGMSYQVNELVIAPGGNLLFYSDGLVEAHNKVGEMFGFPRLKSLLEGFATNSMLIDDVLEAFAAFTGPCWEQEDDITLLSLCLNEGK